MRGLAKKGMIDANEIETWNCHPHQPVTAAFATMTR
jgi:hypothetical protein